MTSWLVKFLRTSTFFTVSAIIGILARVLTNKVEHKETWSLTASKEDEEGFEIEDFELIQKAAKDIEVNSPKEDQGTPQTPWRPMGYCQELEKRTGRNSEKRWWKCFRELQKLSKKRSYRSRS